MHEGHGNGRSLFPARIAALLAVSLILVSGPAAAQAAAAGVTAERPGAGGPADIVRVDVGLLDITKIDELEQVFYIDAYVVFEWTDNRLAIAGAETGATQGRHVPIDTIWTPGLLFVNARGLEARLHWVAKANLMHKERHADAMRLTKVTRLLFPFAYLLTIVLAAAL